MKQWQILIAATLVTILLMGCDAATSVRGIVRDRSGQPIAGASVKLVRMRTGETIQQITGADGSFSEQIIHGFLPGPFRLEVSKSGYETFTQDVKAMSRREITVELAGDKDKPKP
jgi:hypothetical protein